MSKFICGLICALAIIAFATQTNVYAQTQTALSNTLFDFDGDGKADISIFRADPNPDNHYWYILNSTNGETTTFKWGYDYDYMIPADYDGDGITDYAVWRNWETKDLAFCYIVNSSNGSVRVEQFGQIGDVLMVGDWDGDRKADLAVYRDSAEGSQSYFYYRGSLKNRTGSITYIPWGVTGDRPMRGDFDGDGKFDAAVFRPSDGLWYIMQSSDGQVRYESWGLASDKFVPADYDGDGKTDLAVYRVGISLDNRNAKTEEEMLRDGNWFIRQSSDGQTRHVQFGLIADMLIPADYDGDGKIDIAVCRDGTWYILHSSDNQVVTMEYGWSTDKPVTASYLY